MSAHRSPLLGKLAKKACSIMGAHSKKTIDTMDLPLCLSPFSASVTNGMNKISIFVEGFKEVEGFKGVEGCKGYMVENSFEREGIQAAAP